MKLGFYTSKLKNNLFTEIFKIRGGQGPLAPFFLSNLLF